MKKLVVPILGLILLSTLTLGIITLTSQEADSLVCIDVCHVYYDSIEQKFFCMGYPSNCCCLWIPLPPL